jgi:hypothetical protein
MRLSSGGPACAETDKTSITIKHWKIFKDDISKIPKPYRRPRLGLSPWRHAWLYRHRWRRNPYHEPVQGQQLHAQLRQRKAHQQAVFFDNRLDAECAVPYGKGHPEGPAPKAGKKAWCRT